MCVCVFSDIQNKKYYSSIHHLIGVVRNYCSRLSFVRGITNVGEYLLFYTRVKSLVPPKEKYREFHKDNASNRLATAYLVLMYQKMLSISV